MIHKLRLPSGKPSIEGARPPCSFILQC